MFDRAEIGVQAAIDAGATYADARATMTKTEAIVVQDA
jgi:hypothetical protein